VANPYAQTQGTPVTFPAGVVGNVGGSQPHNNMMPYLVLNFIIALQGIFPSRN
jgi:microcystin-dependent protein